MHDHGKISKWIKNTKKREYDIDNGTVCQLINASIEEEMKAGHEYTEIIEALPQTEEYEECFEALVEIMEDEINHAITLIKIGKTLGCDEPELDEGDEDLLTLVDHIEKIKIK